MVGIEPFGGKKYETPTKISGGSVLPTQCLKFAEDFLGVLLRPSVLHRQLLSTFSNQRRQRTIHFLEHDNLPIFGHFWQRFRLHRFSARRLSIRSILFPDNFLPPLCSVTFTYIYTISREKKQQNLWIFIYSSPSCVSRQ